MKISLTISFIFHIILLLAFRDLLPLKWNQEIMRSYRVDIIRPPVENMNLDDISEAAITQIREEMKNIPSAMGEEETISLDTKDKRYISYAKTIKQELLRHWRYPKEAKDHLLEGNLMVTFSLSRNGNVIKFEITNNSGYDILDGEAIRAIRTAAPFPSFPDHITAKRLNIRANFNYQLTAHR